MSTPPAPTALKPDRIDRSHQVIQGRWRNIAIEMGYKLMRMTQSFDHPRVRRIFLARLLVDAKAVGCRIGHRRREAGPDPGPMCEA